MAESSDYNPGVWKGYDFKTARATYDAHAGRSYADAVDKGVKRADLVPEQLETKSEAPVVIACDVTGSMQEWPATIFSKLPYLDLEGKEYLGETMEISYAAIGDAFSDKYPLQVQPFVGGKEMEASLKKLVIERGGGGSSEESYDLAALYYARNVKMPNAVRPIMIFIGDEGLYSFVDKDKGSEWARVALEKRMSLEDLFAELKRRYSVYIVRKPYGSASSNSRDTADDRIQKQWQEMLGDDHVVSLPEAGRVVDVIFGIFARETNKAKYFKKELEGRQTEEQVELVMKSLKTIHLLPGSKADDSKSKSKGGKSKKAAAKSMKKLPADASMTRRKGSDDGKPSADLV